VIYSRELMMSTRKTQVSPPTAIPAAVTAWLAAHAAHDADAEVAQVADDIVVVDDGHTYRGREAVRDWSTGASTEYHYTATVLQSEVDGDETVVTARLEGNFPGSPIELRYRFTLTEGQISALVIGA
jgi:ketosteroid isomerase-like protein